MDLDVEGLCGAGYGERSPERTNSRNGYRDRMWDTRAGTVELKIPKVRAGSYPGPRKRAAMKPELVRRGPKAGRAF